MLKTCPTPKQSALAFVVGFLIFQLGAVLVFAVGIFVGNILGSNVNQVTTFFYTGLGYLLLSLCVDAMLVFVFFIFNKKSNNIIISKPNLKKLLIYILIAIISFFMLSPVINCCDFLFVNLGIQLNVLPYELNLQNFLFSIVSLVILPAICEELLFRGFIFKGLKPIGKSFSILMSALFFALFHMSIDQFLYPFLMGLLLGVIMHRENNILYCIVVHLVNNFLSLIFSYWGISLFSNHIWFFILAIALLIIFLALLLPNVFKNSTKREKLSNDEKFVFWTCFALMCLIWVVCFIVKVFNVL